MQGFIVLTVFLSVYYTLPKWVPDYAVNFQNAKINLEKFYLNQKNS